MCKIVQFLFYFSWEQRKLGDVFDYERPDAYIVTSDRYSDTYSTPVLTANKGFILGYTNEVQVCNKECIIFDDFTLESKHVTFPFMVKSSALKILTAKNDYFLPFAYEMLQATKIEILGHARHYISVVQPTKVLVPRIEEQVVIGKCIQGLDNLITLHQRKCGKLKNIKAALLEKMFPSAGSSTPKIRFKGYTNTWEQRKFKESVEIERGGSPRPIDDYITNETNGLNWVKIGDAPEQGNVIVKTAEKIKPSGLSKTRQVQIGDLILSNSMSFGKPYIMGINGCIHDGWLLIRDVQGAFDLLFLCQLLGTDQMLRQYKARAAGSIVNNLNKELVGNTLITVPTKHEQHKLGELFQKVDNLITLHQRKVEKLKNIKSALLEKMFV